MVNRFRNIVFQFLTFIFVLVSVSVDAQEVTFTLLRATADEVVIRADFPDYKCRQVDVNGIKMNRLSMENACAVLSTGAPELLESAVSLIIPDDCSPTAEVIASDYQLLTDFALAPSKGRLLRSVNPDTVAYRRGDIYREDRFLCNDTVTLGTPYHLRDYRGLALHFYPFAYNPVQKILKAYRSITARIRFHGTLGKARVQKLNAPFDALYDTHFLNYRQVRSSMPAENGDILILAPDDFCSALQPYADWKIKTGYATEIVPLSEVGGTSAAVKDYIASYYSRHNLAFVLIVGDDGQFPVISVGGNVSDNYYAEIVGNDYYPDVILGKISAETVEQVNTQVSRFIEYERNPAVTDHFPVYCGISSAEGPGYNGAYDYEHVRNLGTMLSAYTYTSGYEIFDGSQGGLDASGDARASQITAAVNAGVGIINYCGHGTEMYWGTSNFSVSNVNSLHNEDKLPVILSVSCSNGNYCGQTCFAETWLRATHNNKPSGAVGTLMSTISQPWESPMCAQEEMIKFLTGYDNYAKMNTFGGIVFGGLIKMLDNYDDYEVSRTWLLFGDPSLLVRTAVPQPLLLSYADSCVLGASDLMVSSPVENARITLSCRNQLLATGFIVDGTVTLALPDTISIEDTLCVVGTALHYLPSIGRITLFSPHGPYLVCSTMTLHDSGNNDALADHGETVIMTPAFTNVGSDDATNVVVKYRTQDPYIIVLDSVLQIDALNSLQSGVYSSAFTIRIADDAPAAHRARIVLHISHDCGRTQDAVMTLLLHAPLPTILDFRVDDTESGNGNSRLDSGEVADIFITLQNTGNGDAFAGLVTIANPENNLHIFRPGNVIPSLAQDEKQVVAFRVQVKKSVPLPATATLHITFQVGQYSASRDIVLKLGIVAEDWESGGFAGLGWENNSTEPWRLTTQRVYAGQYAARSGNIGNNASSSLSITLVNDVPDTLSFYYYVSSEASYDFLNFYIDDSLAGSWSGEIPWKRAVYYVPTGQHTYRWEYSKDVYKEVGDDMAMIDNICFPCLGSNSVAVTDHVEPVISLSPNPTVDCIRLTVPSTGNLSHSYCQIYDICGKLLRVENVTSPSTVIDLTGLTDGLYVFRVLNNNTILKTFKVVKK